MSGKHDLDFSYVREHSDFIAVLEHYGIEPIGSMPQVKALCPFHDDTKPSLAVNTERNIFNCFACEAKGNILDFVMLKDDLKPRPAGIKLAAMCGISQKANGKAKGSQNGKAKSLPSEADDRGESVTVESEDAGDQGSEGIEDDEVSFNKPLTFELKLDIQTHNCWLASRGVSPGHIETFGVGLAEKGMMAGRVCIPIHNEKGELVAYCGRYPADEMPEDEPKYKLPPGFRKDLEVFNLHRSPASSQGTMLLVESYLSVMNHWMPDFPVVSTMGRSISSQQVQKLVDHGVKRALIWFDGDKPGRDGAEQVAIALARAGIWVVIGNTPEGKKPHQIRRLDMWDSFPHGKK